MEAALIPYSQGSTAGAAALARAVYAGKKYGPTAKAAATTFARMYRGRQARKRTEYLKKKRAEGIGQDPNKLSGAKKCRMDAIQVGLKDTRILYSVDLTGIAKTTTDAIDLRERDVINVSGFSISMVVRSETAASFQRICCAVISPKDNVAPTAAPSNFFRDYTTNRNVAFSTGSAYLEMAYAPINPDKYRILWRGNYMLAPANTAATSNNPPDNFHFKQYVKLDRQITYNGAGSTDYNQGIYFVYWADTVMVDAAALSIPDTWSEQHDIVTYFHEVESGKRRAIDT